MTQIFNYVFAFVKGYVDLTETEGTMPRAVRRKDNIDLYIYFNVFPVYRDQYIHRTDKRDTERP